MTDRDTVAGYDLVIASHWLPVHGEPPRPRIAAGSAARALRRSPDINGAAWIGCTTGPTHDAYLADDVWLHPVGLGAAEAEDYYHGHCLSTLAPLYLDCGEPVRFDPGWAEAYRRINHRIAMSAATIAAPGATVWVHDYHLQSVPAYLRRMRPDLQIGLFLHGTFPAVERFAQQPMRDQVLAGLLGADLIGFQHSRSAVNFLGTAVNLARLPQSGTTLRVGGRCATAGVFPSSVDAAQIARLADDPRVRERARQIREMVGDPGLALLSVGSPDPADGVRQSLDVYAQLLAEGRLDPGETVLIHVGASGDEDLDARPAEREQIERKIAQINGVHGRLGRPVIHYARGDLDLTELVALYLAADVMLATPLRQGMTLAAKEFLAARTDGTGRLVLSEFSGAAAELPEAHIVNPYDTDCVKLAILGAAAQCHAPSDEIRRLRHRLEQDDVQSWSTRFLAILTIAADPGSPDDLASEVCP